MEGVPLTGQTWTPAPKKGIIPLHPLTFGMLLGKAFAALRHNPKVLFGFAVVVQLIVTIVATGVMSAVLFTTFSRLETVPSSSPDYEAVFAGTIGINIVAGIVVGLATIAVTAVMQGVIAADIGYATVGVKATLNMLWRRMAPAFWPLAGFASLVVLTAFGLVAVVVVVIAAVTLGIFSGNGEVIVIAGLVILIALVATPLVVWLSTKLLLVPSILVLERARFREALVRSWRLTRGRFWVAFGVMFLIFGIMSVAMQVVSIPGTLVSSLLIPIIAPTGAAGPSAVVFFLAILAPQILVLIIQAIATVVQSTGAALIYVDCRMRYEGLDQTLLSYLERHNLGWTREQQGDPFRVDATRAVSAKHAVSSAPPPQQVPDHLLITNPHLNPYPPHVDMTPAAFPPPPPSVPPTPAANTPTVPPSTPAPAERGWAVPGSDDSA